MDTPKTAIGVLTDAKRELRKLIGMAAADGDYDAAQRITMWAQTLGAVAQEALGTGALQVGEASEAHLMLGRKQLAKSREGGRFDLAAASATDAAPSAGHRNNGKTSRRSKRAPAKGEYPKFFRRDDQLVKIGWSKKERSEYEHKAPRRVVDALTAAIVRRSGNGKLFTVDDLLPLKDPQDGSEMPGYQVYVALAWFKVAGLVKQHGRSGYSAKNAARLNDNTASAWVQLLEKQNV